jgi:hypothetical protein
MCVNMRGVLNFALVLVCLETLIPELGADLSTNKRPPAMAEPTSGEERIIVRNFVQYFVIL